VFVDICEDYNIDPARIEAALTRAPKRFLPVHWSGKPCDMDPIAQLAARRGIRSWRILPRGAGNVS